MAGTSSTPPQLFDYFLVLDFEATCDLDAPPQPQEIIEWPTLKVNALTFETEATFHRYVRPHHHPRLSPFCSQLTGIIQDMVEREEEFPAVLAAFEAWLEAEGLGPGGASFALVTCGDWDLKSMLPRQAALFPHLLPLPDHFRRWVNVKKPFFDVTRTWGKGMMSMLAALDLPHQGRHHSGIDDAHNIARLLHALAQRGKVFQLTSAAPQAPPQSQSQQATAT